MQQSRTQISPRNVVLSSSQTSSNLELDTLTVETAFQCMQSKTHSVDCRATGPAGRKGVLGIRDQVCVQPSQSKPITNTTYIRRLRRTCLAGLFRCQCNLRKAGWSRFTHARAGKPEPPVIGQMEPLVSTNITVSAEGLTGSFWERIPFDITGT